MHSTGLLPFLPEEEKIGLESSKSVNALNGLTSISTSVKKRMLFFLLSVSMPSTGLLPFLQVRDGHQIKNFLKCQCPQRAYFHFYSIESQLTKINSILCQCPQRAYFHFYYEAAYIFDQYEVCQCPQRAYFHFYGKEGR